VCSDKSEPSDERAGDEADTVSNNTPYRHLSYPEPLARG